MAASFTIAARNNGFSKADAREATQRIGEAYRERDGRVRGDGHHGHLVRAPLRGRDDGGHQDDAEGDLRRGKAQKRRRPRAGARGVRKQIAAQGAHARQPAGALQARRGRGRQAPHRQPAADRGPVARASTSPATASTRTSSSKYIHAGVPRLPGDAAERPPPPAREVRAGRRGAQGGRRRQRRHAGLHRAAAGARRGGPAVPAGQGGDADRCSRTTCRRAATSRAHGWCTASA